MIVGLSKSLYK